MTSIFNCRTTSFPASLISSPSEASEEGGGSGGGEGVRWETPETRLIVALCAPLLQTVSAPACVLSLQASPMKTYEEACRRARCCMSSYSIGWPLLTELHLLLQCCESGLLSFRLFVCLFFRSEEEGNRGWWHLHLINPSTKHMWLSWNVSQSSDNTEHQIQIGKNQGAHPGIWGILRGLVTKGAFCWARGKWCHATDGLNDFAWLRISVI